MMADDTMVAAPEPGTAAISLAEVKAFLRLERDDEDALLAGFIRTAMALCEAFTGQWLMARDGEARLAADGGWQRLTILPVLAITGVRDGAGPLPPDAFEIDIDTSGTGWVRLTRPAGSGRPVACFRAGLANDWNGLPEALRQGLIRLVAHLFTHRDAADAGPPPAAVAALWRPWRRMRIG